ncbi:MAG: hypothetical protein VXW32_09025 [Myxococcota bacterium]|nr:hypothetical protein [Myxococcota bacterium]
MRLVLLLLVACSGESEPPATTPSEVVSPAEQAPGRVPMQADLEAETSSLQPSDLPRVVLPERQATTPNPVVADAEIESALKALKRLVAEETADPHNPWAIAHGLLALGEGLQLSNGKTAVDGLFEGFAENVETEGHALIAFPRSATGPNGQEIRVEPHTDLVMKALAETGVRLDTLVTVEGESHQLGKLYFDTVLGTYLDLSTGGSSFTSPNDMPWGLQAIATYAPPDLSWVNQGKTQELNQLTSFLVHVLTMESQTLFQWMTQGGEFRKDGKGIFGYTCGGSHMLQGAAYLVGKGFGSATDRQKMAAQVELLFWRFPRELQVYKTAVQQHPTQELVITVQQLKFVGHWLESVHKMAAMKLFEPTESQQVAMGEAVRVLVETAKQLKRTGAMDNLETLREGNEQLYLDIVGDASHAVRGLELALGRATVAY